MQVVKDLQRNPNFKEADSARLILGEVRGELYRDAWEAQGPAVVDDSINIGDTVKLLDIGGIGERCPPLTLVWGEPSLSCFDTWPLTLINTRPSTPQARF